MVNAFKHNPKTVGWANSTSPVVDVTDVLKQKYSNIKSAHLTIYGDPSRVKVVYRTATQPPAQGVDQIISNWQRGIEVERQYCTKDHLYYLVEYPAKLEVQTTNGKSNIGPTALFLAIAAAVAIASYKAAKR